MANVWPMTSLFATCVENIIINKKNSVSIVVPWNRIAMYTCKTLAAAALWLTGYRSTGQTDGRTDGHQPDTYTVSQKNKTPNSCP